MKILLILGLVFSSSFIGAQQPAIMEYAAIPSFHWGLFQGKINKDHIAQMGLNTGAVTVSSISFSSEQTSAKEATIIITARFHTQDSWTRYPEMNNPDEALNHEKRHMEITEIYARKLRQAVSRAKFSSKHFHKELDRLFHDYVTQHRAEQVRYDHETNHSTVTEQQRKWDKKIDGWLEELSAFSDSSMKVNLN